MAANAKPLFIKDDIINTATLTATNEATGFDVEYIGDDRLGTWWKATGSGTLYVYADAGAAVAADSLLLAGHNLGASSANATVSLEKSASGAWAGEEVEVVAGFIPSDDTAFFKEWASTSSRYWRLKIVTASVAPYIAIWMLGAKIELQHYLEDGYDPTPEMPNEEATRAHGGAHVGVVSYATDLDFSLDFKRLTDAWMLATFDPFWVSHMRHPRPIGYVWDKTNHASEVHVVMRKLGTGKRSPYNQSRRSLTLKLSGVVEE